MLRFIHLSDFHLNPDNFKDLDLFIMKNLTTDLLKVNEECKIDFIICSGDLIDQGGKGFSVGLDYAFLDFEEKVINPLINSINIPKENFLMCPGNHDIDRNKDTIIDEQGLKATLTSIESVNKFIDSGQVQGIQRILPFKTFEKYYYNNFPGENQIANFNSTYKFMINNCNIGVTCFNTAWRSYDSKLDKGVILMGERQITNALSVINDCEIKIGIIHHPIDWLNDFEKENIEAFLLKNFDILFCGHNHKSESWQKTGTYGSLFVSISPYSAASDIRDSKNEYSLGYSIIDYDYYNSQIITSFRKYHHKKQSYIPDNDLGDENGRLIISIPSNDALYKQKREKEIAKYIRNVYFEAIDELLVTYNTDTKAPQKIDTLFVMPEIVSKVEYDIEKNDREITYTLSELCSFKENTIIFGAKESGKTILLNKILIELTNEITTYRTIPIFCDFNSIGHTKFETIINRFLGIGITEVDDLLKNYNLVLLIDNLSFDSNDLLKLNRFQEFLQTHNNIKVFATCTQIMEGQPPINFVEHEMFSLFKVLSIKSFKTKEIRELVHRWFIHNKDYDTPDKLENLTKLLLALNLPRTPLSISVFLWIIEKQENYNPINSSTMLENFIERLLKKHAKKELSSDSFDFTNKQRLLASIAYFMYQKNLDNYKVSSSELLSFIQSYLQSRKFEFSPSDILEGFLTRGLIIKEIEDQEYIRFRFSCFFQYFLTKKMDYDSEFKNYVLSPDNFLFFVDEIDYFTGLKRDQIDILKLLVDRMNEHYEEILKFISGLDNTFDNIFDIQNCIAEKLDDAFPKALATAQKPTETELDQINDSLLEKSTPEGIIRKEESLPPFEKFWRLWMLAAKVLKNTEETSELESDLKDWAYENILRCSMAFANLYKYRLEMFLIKNKDYKIEENLLILKRALPLAHELLLLDLIGTLKLSVVIRDRFIKDIENPKVSDFQKFVSVFLYADIKGPNYEKYIKQFIKEIRMHYIFDMSLFKLLYYLFYRSKTKESDQRYLDIVAELIIKSKGKPKKKNVKDNTNNEKGNLINLYRQKKTKKLFFKKEV